MDVNVSMVWSIVFNATFNNISVISWRSVLLVEETGVPGEDYRPVAMHWQTLSQCCIENTSPCAGLKFTTLAVIGTDWTGSCKSNYHTITTTMALVLQWKFTLMFKFVSTEVGIVMSLFRWSFIVSAIKGLKKSNVCLRRFNRVCFTCQYSTRYIDWKRL